jgi:nucleoid-associated protein YgaU
LPHSSILDSPAAFHLLRPMFFARLCLTLAAAFLLSGCGYIHFGRLEKTPAGSDAALVTAYSNLSTEHKILKQELVLVRREGDALRKAIDGGATGTGAEATARLNEATRELATLRTAYAQLQAERTAAPAPAGSDPRLRDLEDKLATALRQTTQLQDENSRLRGELDRTRGENATLATQLKASAAKHDDARQALEMLNAELLAQKQARARAEQAHESARIQLKAVLDQATATAPPTLAAAREATAASTAALHLARSPTSGSAATAELRTDAERLRRAAEAGGASPAPPTPRPTVHVVQAGDTLEQLALKYYGSTERWRTIYEANLALVGGGQSLRVGTELRLP